MAKTSDKFKDTYYVAAYEYAAEGMSDNQMAKAIGVSLPTLQRWFSRYPAMKDAVKRGRKRGGAADGGGTATIHNYVYQHLPPELRELWDEIRQCSREHGPANGAERLEAMLAKGGKRARQHLFLHALTQTGFNVSKAMKLLNVPRSLYDKWRKEPEFADLVDEMQWHMDNFFEAAFFKRVKAGDTSAIIHAAKTRLRPRGYGDRVEIEHSGEISMRNAIDITMLNLPLPVRAAVLEAVRLMPKEPKLLENAS